MDASFGLVDTYTIIPLDLSAKKEGGINHNRQ